MFEDDNFQIFKLLCNHQTHSQSKRSKVKEWFHTHMRILHPNEISRYFVTGSYEPSLRGEKLYSPHLTFSQQVLKTASCSLYNPTPSNFITNIAQYEVGLDYNLPLCGKKDYKGVALIYCFQTQVPRNEDLRWELWLKFQEKHQTLQKQAYLGGFVWTKQQELDDFFLARGFPQAPNTVKGEMITKNWTFLKLEGAKSLHPTHWLRAIKRYYLHKETNKGQSRREDCDLKKKCVPICKKGACTLFPNKDHEEVRKRFLTEKGVTNFYLNDYGPSRELSLPEKKTVQLYNQFIRTGNEYFINARDATRLLTQLISLPSLHASRSEA